MSNIKQTLPFFEFSLMAVELQINNFEDYSFKLYLGLIFYYYL